jgi:hypothetical protein
MSSTTSHSWPREVYNEPYRAAPLTSRRDESADRLTVEYRVTWGGRDHVLRATGAKPPVRPGPGSVEQFFKEHSWGFGRTRWGRTLRYEVRHPVWEVYPVRDFGIDVDWATLYSPEWAVMQGAAPDSAVLAKGSPVAVYPRGRPPADARVSCCSRS